MSIRFAVLGMHHSHIYGQTRALINAGAELVNYYEPVEEYRAEFVRRFPDAQSANSEAEILEDPTIHLITSASIPNERAALNIRIMQHGKDCLVDKPLCTTLEQLDELRRVQRETGRICAVWFAERLDNPATMKAGDLVHSGAIGRVVSVIGTGPHKISNNPRPDWFYNTETGGGILNFIGSHQIEQFLYFTGSTSAEIVAAQVANFNSPQRPEFEDYGDVMLRSASATGYFQLHWLTPAGLPVWGDVRLFITGTEGAIELRKNIDLEGKPGTNHLFLVDERGTQYIDCAPFPLTFAPSLVNDVLNRTDTAQNQTHAFYATELAIRAQNMANARQTHVLRNGDS
jgi:predicted dehydrogenase